MSRRDRVFMLVQEDTSARVFLLLFVGTFCIGLGDVISHAWDGVGIAAGLSIVWVALLVLRFRAFYNVQPKEASHT